MAEGVVHALEAIEVQEEQGGEAVLALRVVEDALQVVGEHAPVRKARQVIVKRPCFELLFELFALRVVVKQRLQGAIWLICMSANQVKEMEEV